MKRYAKELIKAINRLGFEYIWTNSSGHHCYAHPDDRAQTELVVNPSLTEEAHRAAIRRAQKITGTLPARTKRQPRQIKERAAAERDRARHRLQWAHAKHDRLVADNADPARITKISELVEQRRRELATLERLMTQTPQGGSAHRGSGQVRHISGGEQP